MKVDKKKNCTIIIEQKNAGEIRQSMFQFDDYRVATALENILCNVNDVSHKVSVYKEG